MSFYIEPDPDGEALPPVQQNAQAKGQWLQNAGGCLNGATWRQNAQFLLTLGATSDQAKTHLEVQLTRANTTGKVSIGVYIVPHLKGESLPMLSFEEAMSTNSMQKVAFSGNVTATGEFYLPQGEYVLVPCTFEAPNTSLTFDLAVKSSTSSVALRPLPQLEFSLRCTGTWVPPEQVSNTAKARFSFSSDEDTLVRVWLAASNRTQNPEPVLHLWKFKLLENIDISRFNGEVSTQFHVSANTPYFLVATPTSASSLGNFHMMISSDHPLDFSDTNIDAVPALVDPNAFAPKAPSTPKKDIRAASRTNSSDVPVHFPRQDPKSIAIGFSGTFEPNKAISMANPKAITATFTQSPVGLHHHPSMISPHDDDIPPPPDLDDDPFNSTPLNSKAVPGKQDVILPNPSGSPMLRGRLIDSTFTTSEERGPTSGNPTSNEPSNGANPPLIPSPVPGSDASRSSSSPRPEAEQVQSANSTPRISPMAPLPRPPSVHFSNTPTSVISSTSSIDSHRIQFSMESNTANNVRGTSTGLVRSSSPHIASIGSEVGNLSPSDSVFSTIRFFWTKDTAGGNARCRTWRNNAQWLLEVSKSTRFIFTLAQLGHQPPVSVGVYVLRANSYGPLRRIQIDDEEQKIIFDDSPTSSFTMDLPIGKYIIIPCTEMAGIEREAILSIKSKEPGEFTVQSLSDTWSCISQSGEWNPDTSGGCWTEHSWMKNTQYQLTFQRRAQVTICLSVERQPPSPIGFYVVHNQKPTFKNVLEMTPETLLFPVQFRQRTEIVKTIQGSDGEVFNIIPATFVAQQESYKYTLSVYTAEPGLVQLEDTSKYTEKLSYRSKWSIGGPGGCLDHSSWRHNPQLKVSFPWVGEHMQIGFVLTQWQRFPEEDEEDARLKQQNADGKTKDEPPKIAATQPKNAPNATGSSSSSPSSSSAPLNSIITSTPMEYGADDQTDYYEPFGFYVYPVEDQRVKRVVLERNDLLMPPAMATARRVTGSMSVGRTLVSDDGIAQLIVSPFSVNQYVERATNYELQIVIQSSEANFHGNTDVIPAVAPIPQARANISHRSEWADPLAASLSGTASIVDSTLSSSSKSVLKELSSPEAVKLSRAVIRRFQIFEPNTLLVILLIQKAFCLGQIQVFKIGTASPNTPQTKVTLDRKEEDILLLLTRSKLVHSSKVSRSKENTLECMIAEPGFYAVCAIPEVPESVGPILLVVHYWKPIKDLNVDNTSSSEKQAKRSQVIGEILSTETSYVKNLKVLVHHFMSSLVARSVELGVDVEDVKKIFSNIPTLLNCNTAFLEQLKATTASGENAVGRVFNDFCNFFRMYAEYTNHFDSNCKLLEELKKKSSFKDALLALENSPLANRLHFRDFYITPVQRIPRYALLLEQLLRYTDSTNADYQNLVQSYDRVKNVAFDINEKKRRADAEALVVSIQGTVFYKKSKENPLIAIPARLFLRSGGCTVLGVGPGDARTPQQLSPTFSKKSNKASSSSSGSSNPLIDIPSLEQATEADFIFLFNDAIILTQAKKGKRKYTWKHQIPLTSDSDVSTHKDTVICLRTPVTTSVTVTYFFEFATAQIRDLWMSELSVLIQVLVNLMHHKLSSKVVANCKLLDSKMQMLLPS